jgi:SET family sugar efflux transporter-like MFS transporter
VPGVGTIDRRTSPGVLTHPPRNATVPLVAPAAGPRPPSSLRTVLASPLYRGATIALFASGFGTSIATPQIARFLVEELHASLTVAGLYYLSSLTTPIAGYLLGARSDRTGNRLGIFRFCAVIGCVGWVLVAFSTQVWQPFVISAVLLSVAGGAGSQLFAAIHDDVEARHVENGDGVVSFVRMALTGGWVIGPVAGAFLLAAFGFTPMLLVTAASFLLEVVPLGLLKDPERPSADLPGDAEPSDPSADGTERTGHAAAPGMRAMLPLLAFTGLYVLVYVGEPIRYAYLPIRMARDMHVSAGISGAVIGIQPLVELLLMPLAVVVARRIGLMPLMVFGAGFGTAAHLFFTFSDASPGLFAGQILMGGVWGIFAGLGIIVAQRLLPTAVATASSIFMSAPPVASAVGGVVGGLGVDVLGLPLVFLAPAVSALLAVIGLIVMSRSRYGVR